MANVWVQALLVVCAVGVTFAWRHHGYYMSRRDTFVGEGNERAPWRTKCGKTGDMCLENAYCCYYSEGKDLCATPIDNTGRDAAECKPRIQIQKGYQPTLEDGATCKSSGECRSGCCRKMNRGRFQPTFTCGPPSRDVMCADYSKKNARFMNEIYDYPSR